MGTREADLRLSLSYVSRTYFADFPNRGMINEGWCYVWAWLIKLAHPEVLLWTSQSADADHAFIQCGHLYYDSQSPRGVRRIESLRFFREYPLDRKDGKLISTDSLQEFQRLWACGGPEFDTQRLPRWPTTLPLLRGTEVRSG